MQKRSKNIITLLLLSIGLALFAHSVLPHDHHYNYFTENSYSGHHETGENGRAPVHCHLLNALDINITHNTSNLSNRTTHFPGPGTPLYKQQDFSFDFSVKYRLFLPVVSYTIGLNPHISPTRGSPLS